VTERDPRRRFNKTERAILYLLAEGRCVECEEPLDPGWHSDHVIPHSLSGATELLNGQALCPACNLKKGATVEYTDTFEPRPFQADVIETVLNRHAAGKRVTVVEAATGAGKTLTSQATACELLRANAIDVALILVPRINLAQQYELDWREPCVEEPRRNVPGDWTGDFEKFDPRCRIESFDHTPNRSPLLPRGPRGRAVVTTYSSLVSAGGQAVFGAFARQYAGRFLLVADEAQFCGDESDTGGGTKAGQMVKMLSDQAAHTLLMTGTPYRSDGNPLILAEYGEPDSMGMRRLLSHVASTYQDGIREGYLRTFEATLHNARVNRHDLATGTDTEFDLSLDGSDLRQVLRRSDVWQPIVDDVVAVVRAKRCQHPDYRGLISCMEVSDAKTVYEYLRRTYPDLRTYIATSDDGDDARNALKAFRTGPADILVTVRMAFIGYSCKAISVIGVLTNYRDAGHLMQLVGRGLRVWDEEPYDAQSCRIVGPDDPKMQEFIEVLRQQRDLGLRDRQQGPGTGPGGGPGTGGPTTVVTDAWATGRRAVSNDAELDSGQLNLIDSLAQELGIVADPTKLAAFWEKMNSQPAPQPTATRPPTPPKTGRERIKDLLSETHELIRRTATACGIYPGEPGYQDFITRHTADVNRAAGGNAKAAESSEALARKRRDVARDMFAKEANRQ
jgi:superfamily II DNA or RNA helicase